MKMTRNGVIGAFNRVRSQFAAPDQYYRRPLSDVSGGKLMTSVNVMKKVTFLMMVVALAVSLAACTGATSVKGETGAQGPTGESGPQGPPGTLDNEAPMQVKDLPMAYVALGGTGKTMNNKTAGIGLGDFFKDAETPSLTYTFASSDKDVAEAALEGGKMVVTGKKAGTATITVSVFDNVNAPVTGSFDTVVVNDNAAPTVRLLDVDDTGSALGTPVDVPKLGAELFVSRGASTVNVVSSVQAGTAAGVEDDVTYSVAMGAPGAADDVAKITVADGKKAGTLDITLDPMKSGKQNVVITVTDKFGSEAANKLIFVVLVNTPPKLANPISDITLVIGATSGNTIAIP